MAHRYARSMLKLIVAALAALALGACAPSVPLASTQADAEGKQFQPPAAGSAAAYFYVYRAGDNFAVTAGPRHLGTIGSNAWFRAELPAGPQELGCAIDTWAVVTSPAARADRRNFWTGESKRSVDLVGGQSYFYEIGVRASMVAVTCTIAEVSPADGKAAILQRRRALDPR